MTNKIDKTLKERGSRYGSFEHNAKITQRLCNVLKQAPNYDLLEEEHIEAFHMIFHKIARCVCGDPNYIDNIHDIIGYAKLLEGFLKDKEKILEYFDKLDSKYLTEKGKKFFTENQIQYDNRGNITKRFLG